MRTRDLGITHRAGSPGTAQCHHGRAGRAGRARHDHRGRWAARRRPGSGPDRRHRRRPARTGRLARAGLRRLSPAQRQRRADRPRMGPRVRDADDSRSRSRTRTASASSGTPWSRPRSATRTRRGIVVTARRRRDVRRPAQRHQRLPRPPGAPPRGARRGDRRPGRRRATSVAGRGWSATSSRAGSGPRRGSSPADRGGHTVGVLVQANYGKRALAPGRRRPGRRRDRHRRGPEPVRPGRAERVADPPPGSGSIIIVVATDAPLLPHQCERLAQRAGLGHRPCRRDGRAHERRPVHRIRDGQSPARGRRGSPANSSRTTSGRSATSSSTRCSTRPSRRPRRRSSTPWSRPRRWSGGTGSPPTPSPTTGCSRSWPATGEGQTTDADAYGSAPGEPRCSSRR